MSIALNYLFDKKYSIVNPIPSNKRKFRRLPIPKNLKKRKITKTIADIIPLLVFIKTIEKVKVSAMKVSKKKRVIDPKPDGSVKKIRQPKSIQKDMVNKSVKKKFFLSLISLCLILILLII